MGLQWHRYAKIETLLGEFTTKESRLPGFYKLTTEQRRQQVADFAGLTVEETAQLGAPAGLSQEQAEHMIENVIGVYSLPLAIATNFTVNGRDVLVPMVIEEPSVVAGLSYAARLVRDGGGFLTSSDEPVMIGQMQILDVADPSAARLRLLAAQSELLALANQQDPILQNLGGGAREIEVRVVTQSPVGPMLVLHLHYDVRDAMGANAVNTAVEALTSTVERLSGGRVGLRIVTNLADKRLARASGRVLKASLALEGLSPEQGVQRILEAHAFACIDPYRAATHNKGIMNGIDAAVLATGNDWRAVEAGAHAYAAISGQYKPLTTWERTAEGDLIGSIELPLAVGIVGGATRVHPQARLALKIMGVTRAREMAEVLAAVGLAQNLAALRALAMEGIQRGHMQLHARQVAMAAGAEGKLVDIIAERMLQERVIRLDRAEAILSEFHSWAES
ncbi:MAG: hydroxymethylglutaryl-CoA reductase, degradative [Anaerolineae bacterium]